MQISSCAPDKVFSVLFSDRVTTPNTKWNHESDTVKPNFTSLFALLCHTCHVNVLNSGGRGLWAADWLLLRWQKGRKHGVICNTSFSYKQKIKKSCGSLHHKSLRHDSASLWMYFTSNMSMCVAVWFEVTAWMLAFAGCSAPLRLVNTTETGD